MFHVLWWFGLSSGSLRVDLGPVPALRLQQTIRNGPDEAAAHLTARRHDLGMVVRLLSCSALPAQVVPYEKKEHAQSTGVTSQV